MTVVTVKIGADPRFPHTHYIGCAIPGALWAGCILVCVLSCYTTDYIRHVCQEIRIAAGLIPDMSSARYRVHDALHAAGAVSRVVSRIWTSACFPAGARIYLPSRSCGNVSCTTRTRGIMSCCEPAGFQISTSLQSKNTFPSHWCLMHAVVHQASACISMHSQVH